VAAGEAPAGAVRVMVQGDVRHAFQWARGPSSVESWTPVPRGTACRPTSGTWSTGRGGAASTAGPS